MKILICGSRNYKDFDKILETVRRYMQISVKIVIIEGGAKGADELAKKAAEELNIEVREYKADWNRYGRVAGPKRNQQMIGEERPDLIIAFHEDIESSKGTKDMIKRAIKNNISYEIVK